MIRDKRLPAFSTKNILVFLFMPQIKRLKWGELQSMHWNLPSNLNLKLVSSVDS